MAINYTVIIPHKNTPDLLQKCLDSIPRRDDVQIIVVDDNSDEDKVDFANFPGLHDEYVEVYLTKEGRGAGYARNVGLEQAKGKYIVFADADDFFLPDINTAMDEFVDTNYDVIYFKGTAVSLKDGKPTERNRYNNESVDTAIKTGDFTDAFMISVEPWQKFILRDFLIEYHILFNETMWSNDAVFIAKMVYNARSYFASSLHVYCVTDGGLTKYTHLKSQLVRFGEDCKVVAILEKKDLNYNLHRYLFDSWYRIYKCNKLIGFKKVFTAIKYGKVKFIKEVLKAKFY